MLIQTPPAEPQSPAVPLQQTNLPAVEVRTVALRVPAPSPIFPFGEGQWRPSEQYRILRTKIVQHPKAPTLIVFSSPSPGDGKTVSIINTAAALSLKSESRVLLVDGDLRASTVHRWLGLPPGPGLSDVLAGRCAVEDAVVRTREFPNLYVLPAGEPVANPVELLDSSRWQMLAKTLREQYRYVTVDSPPVAAVADYELIQAASDGVVLVVRPDHTNRDLCKKALEFVPKAKFLGVVLNYVPDWAPGRYAGSDYHHYYYYASQKEYGPDSSQPRE
jgi:receptor protein-tyrosine kinase